MSEEKKFCFDRNTQMSYSNKKANIVIVGITPGNSQTENERNGKSLKQIKKENSFAGTLKTNLIKMLNHICINKL